MACFHPLSAWQLSSGEVVFKERGDVQRSLTLPCGQCSGCRLERSRQWALRCLHEASCFTRNAFVTLTFNDENLPADRSLDHVVFQKFMKRLRRRFPSERPRFYMCGEYGEDRGRPHYHACLFNFDFTDKTYWRRTPSGSVLYRSKVLEELWPFGFCTIGDVTFESAAYVARYVMKKRTGFRSEDAYDWTDEDGVIHKRKPEYNKMSLKPGIGYTWLTRYKSDVYPQDYVIHKGRKVKPPRYYDSKYAEENPEEWEDLELRRFENAKRSFEDNTDDRLAVREQVQAARTSRLVRTLK